MAVPSTLPLVPATVFTFEAETEAFEITTSYPPSSVTLASVTTATTSASLPLKVPTLLASTVTFNGSKSRITLRTLDANTLTSTSAPTLLVSVTLNSDDVAIVLACTASMIAST